MTRRLLVLAVAASAVLPLGGCAVSLFSSSKKPDPDRLAALESRMQRIEERLESR